MTAEKHLPLFKVRIVLQSDFVRPAMNKTGRDMDTRKARIKAKIGKATFQFAQLVPQIKAKRFTAAVIKPNGSAMTLMQSIAQDSIRQAKK